MYVDLGCMLSKVSQAIPSSARAAISYEPLPFTRGVIGLVLDSTLLVINTHASGLGVTVVSPSKRDVHYGPPSGSIVKLSFFPHPGLIIPP